ncbi:hypothetical protein pb186bvf_019296 [Paramecium bursaria]
MIQVKQLLEVQMQILYNLLYFNNFSQDWNILQVNDTINNIQGYQQL